MEFKKKVLMIHMQGSNEDTEVKSRLVDSEGEHRSGMI